LNLSDSEKVTVLLSALNESADEIAERLKSQTQITVAALAGAGVVLANLDKLLARSDYSIFLYIALVYLSSALTYIEQTRILVTRSRFKAQIENELGLASWEDAWNRTRPASFIEAMVSVSRHLATVGVSVLLFIVWFLRVLKKAPQGGLGPSFDFTSILAFAAYIAGAIAFAGIVRGVRKPIIQTQTVSPATPLPAP
jgi:hypothetical protein